MNIAVIGTEKRVAELEQKISSEHSLSIIKSTDLDEYNFDETDLIIDLNLDDTPENLGYYANLDGMPVIGCAVKIQLAEMLYVMGGELNCKLFGINALPYFLQREVVEVSSLNKEDESTLNDITAKLGWQTKVVEDRVGMVTPRIIFMIINEAYYTVQEGTASKEDIDLGMKLGTNYPGGPFEWVEKIGLEEVYETLDALYNDTRDERYKICPLLKTEYLKK